MSKPLVEASSRDVFLLASHHKKSEVCWIDKSKVFLLALWPQKCFAMIASGLNAC